MLDTDWSTGVFIGNETVNGFLSSQNERPTTEMR